MNLSLESLQLSENDSEDRSPSCEHVFKDFELIKIFDYQIKIINELEKTILIWETCTTRDLDTHEWSKAESRASEFRTRFSRNYLYPLRMETRAITNFKKSSDPDQLLKIVTRAYQTALASLCACNAYSVIGTNLPVLDKIKDCVKDIKLLRKSTRDVLEPIEKTIGNDREQLENLCQNVSDIQEIVYKVEPNKKRKMVPVAVKSTLDMYEPKLTTWATKTKLLAKLRYRKKSNRNRVVNLQANVPDLKPDVVKVCKKPVELDGDVETAMDAYSLGESVFDYGKTHVSPPKQEQSTNVGLFCIKSDADEPVEEELIPTMSKKCERILKISPEILHELFRFKIQISEAENDIHEEVNLISQVSDAIISDMIEQVVAEITCEDFLKQLISQELTDMSNEL